MDPAVTTFVLTLISALGGLLVGRSTIRKQNIESNLISVQTFESLRAQVEKMQLTLAEVQADKLEKSKTILGLQDRIQKLESDNEEKDESIASLKGRIQQLESDNRDKDEIIAALNGRLQEFETDREAKNRRIVELEREVSVLRKSRGRKKL